MDTSSNMPSRVHDMQWQCVSFARQHDSMKTPHDPSPSPESAEHQAWVWLRRLHSGDVRPWDAEGFKRWLKASPDHRQAFQAARQEWDRIKPAAGESLAHSGPVIGQVAARHGPQLGRRAFLGTAVAAAAVAGIAVVHPPAGLWPALGEWDADYGTATGEQRVVSLSDGIDLTLNTQTRVRRQTQGDVLTGIDMVSGEAASDLVAGAAFPVAAGRGRSMATAGQFEVRHLGQRVCVSCVQGTVHVEHAAGVRKLRDRQQVFYDNDSLSAVTAIDPAIQSAWRQGKLIFDSTPLAAVIEEINRYRPGRVMLMNAEAGRQSVSGSFEIAMLDFALAQLQSTFGLHARSLPAGLVVLT